MSGPSYSVLVSACHFGQLPSVFDPLLADIVSQGKRSQPHTGIRVGIHYSHSSGRCHMSFPSGHVMSHSAELLCWCMFSQPCTQFALGSSRLLPSGRRELLICLCYASNSVLSPLWVFLHAPDSLCF